MDSLPRIRVLLLEDNPTDALLEKERLLAAGLELDFTLVDGRASFEEAFATKAFDLVLADYSLPDFDGLSALAIVRAKCDRLPFIFVSGVLGEEVAVETMLQGATDYVLKGRLDRLVPAVQRALAEHEEFLRRERAEAELRRAEARTRANLERQGLLLRLLQQQRAATTPDAAMLVAARQVAEYLQASRAGFYDVLDENTLRFSVQWAADGNTAAVTLPLHTLDQARIGRYHRGEVAVLPDILAVETFNPAPFLATGIRAVIGAPLLRGGAWRGGFFVAHREPREWTEQEALFVQEVAEVTWDAVERARATAALEASEQRLRNAAETANLGSWDLDLATGKMTCSDQCKANYGWPLDQDFNYQDLRDSVHPDDRPAMAEAVEQALKNRTTYRAEYRNLWPDGSLHWVIASGRAYYDDKGVPISMTGFTLDVTERHEAQAALVQSEKLAAVGRLASSIAHEINNPLESVTNLLYLASAADDLQAIKSYLDDADQELRRVAAITSQTLRFHRQAGGAKTVSPDELLSGVLMIFQRRLRNGEIAVSTRLRARRTIQCLDGEIRQVLTNLVSNAIDAMQPGGELAIRSRDAVVAGVQGVRFTVADDGSGMSAKTKEKIFDAFFTTKGINGTGLGLWISGEIVRRHGGLLTFRSSDDEAHHGSVFSLFLPCKGCIEEPFTR